MNRQLIRLVVALVLIALVGLAAASTLRVTQRTDTFALFAERIDIPQQVVLAEGRLAPIPAALPALGVEASPLEITAAFPDARTALACDHWAYAVRLEEVTPRAIETGLFAATLFVDGSAVGTIHVSQAAAEPDAKEGAVLWFDLGEQISPDALYHVEVQPVTREGPTVDYVVRSSDGSSWVGVGGAIEDQANPRLDVALDATLRLSARNGDGMLHNIGIKSGSSLVDPPGWSPNLEAVGAEATLVWKPSASGTYTYECRYHPSMSGEIVVAA